MNEKNLKNDLHLKMCLTVLFESLVLKLYLEL